MSYLLDTNIISETTKLKPDKNLAHWLEKVPTGDLYVSVLTIGELKQGIEKLPHSKTTLLTNRSAPVKSKQTSCSNIEEKLA